MASFSLQLSSSRVVLGLGEPGAEPGEDDGGDTRPENSPIRRALPISALLDTSAQS